MLPLRRPSFDDATLQEILIDDASRGPQLSAVRRGFCCGSSPHRHRPWPPFRWYRRAHPTGVSAAAFRWLLRRQQQQVQMNALQTPPASCHLGRSLVRSGKVTVSEAAVGAAETQSPERRWSVAPVALATWPETPRPFGCQGTHQPLGCQGTQQHPATSLLALPSVSYSYPGHHDEVRRVALEARHGCSMSAAETAQVTSGSSF